MTAPSEANTRVRRYDSTCSSYARGLSPGLGALWTNPPEADTQIRRYAVSGLVTGLLTTPPIAVAYQM